MGVTVNIGVCDRRQQSVSTHDELRERGFLPILDLEQALLKEWTWPAHAVPYFIRSSDGEERSARLKKGGPLLSGLLEAPGFDVLTRSLWLDFDLPKKRRWEGPEEVRSWFSYIQDALDPRAYPWAAYSTRHGARLVYVLSEPVDVRRVEALAGRVIREFAAHGIEFDPVSDQWSRLYKLPRVQENDGTETGQDPCFRLTLYKNVIDLGLLEGEEPEDLPAPAKFHSLPKVLDEPEPRWEECKALLFDDRDGSLKATRWFKYAKRRIKYLDPPLADVLFYDGPIPSEGSRDTWLTRTVGKLCGMFFRSQPESAPDTFPACILAVMYEALDRLEPDQDTPSWHSRAWDMILRFSAQDVAKEPPRPSVADTQPTIAAEDPDAALKAANWRLLDPEARMRRVILLLRDTHPYEEELHDDDTAEEWVRRNAILVVGGKAFHLLEWDGCWSEMSMSYRTMIAEATRRQMSDLLGVWRLTEEGMKPKRIDEILAFHAREICGIEHSIMADVPSLVGLGTKAPRLRVPAHRINPAIPKRFDPEIDGWLRKLAGRDYPILEKWLASVPEVRFPTPILSLQGPPGCGKGLLTQGIAEVFDVATHSNEEALTGWNGSLVHNPVIHCDEGVSKITRGFDRNLLSQQLRKLVGGSVVDIRQKFMPDSQLELNPRIVLTANSDKLLSVAVGRLQSEEDMRAMMVRIVHIRCSHAATDYLEDNGGRTFTSDWIGSSSRHRLAGHILHLHATKRESLNFGSRFLVKGSLSAKTLLRFNFSDDAASRILEAVLQLIEQPEGTYMDGRFFDFSANAGVIAVTEQGVRDFYLQWEGRDVSAPLRNNMLREVLTYMSGDHGRMTERQMEAIMGKRPRGGRAWWVMDLKRLALMLDMFELEPLNICRALFSRYGEDARQFTEGVMEEFSAAPQEDPWDPSQHGNSGEF